MNASLSQAQGEEAREPGCEREAAMKAADALRIAGETAWLKEMTNR